MMYNSVQKIDPTNVDCPSPTICSGNYDKEYDKIPLFLQEIMIKNISPAQKEKPHNEVEILVNGEPVIDILEKELIALSGT